MASDDNLETVRWWREEGMNDADVVAVAMLELADSIRHSLSTTYTGASNALELIGQMLGADGGGGAEGRSITGAVNSVAYALSGLADTVDATHQAEEEDD